MDEQNKQQQQQVLSPAQRIEALEQANQRWQWAAYVIGAVLFIAVVIAAVALSQSRREGGKRVLNHLTIQDDQGRPRIQMGKGQIQLFDQEQQRRYSVGTDDDGNVGVKYRDLDGNIRVTTWLLEDGRVEQLYFDSNGKQRIALGTDNMGNAATQIHDTTGAIRIRSAAYSDGTAGTTYLDQDGIERIHVGTDAQGQTMATRGSAPAVAEKEGDEATEGE